VSDGPPSRPAEPPAADAVPAFVRALPLARRALDLAAELHAGQRRDSDGAPFILHPLEVASLLSNTGWPEQVVAAGVLHDVLEDTDTSAKVLEARFGREVAALVAAVTEDPGIGDYEERKAALRRQAVQAGAGARAVFAADKVAKVRELRAQTAHARGRPDAARARRLAHYEASLTALEERDAHAALVRQLRFELWALRRLPPRP
jgi:(p)ppGpp synthase/HD superfamily hydrolase